MGTNDVSSFEETSTNKKDVITHRYRWAKNVPLNEENSDTRVNVIFYEETTASRVIKPGSIMERVRPKSVVKWLQI